MTDLCDDYCVELERLKAALVAVKTERDRLCEGLEFYAELVNYAITQANEPRSAVHLDKGERARAVLEDVDDGWISMTAGSRWRRIVLPTLMIGSG